MMRSPQLTIQSKQSYGIPRREMDQEVYESNPSSPQEDDGNEKQDGYDLMGPSMGSTDDGQYRTMQNAPDPS